MNSSDFMDRNNGRSLKPMSIHEITQAAEQLSTEEQLYIIEHLIRNVRQRTAATNGYKPQDIYGIWRDRVPEDFDVESALNSIRNEWLQEPGR
jgi:hypothetical protein